MNRNKSILLISIFLLPFRSLTAQEVAMHPKRIQSCVDYSGEYRLKSGC
jgi:hypothetical protein